jgi:hypothetical protein
MGQILFNGLRNVWTTVTDRFGRVVARFIIWCIGVAVAFFPAIDSADVGIEWPPARMAAEINERGYFCDLFFVSVVVAILAISNLLDIIIRRVHTLGWITKALAITGMGYQIIYILYAVNHFGRLAHSRGQAIPADLFSWDLNVIWISLAVGISIEIMIALTE